MAITLSNSGISSGAVIKSSEVSQSIDAFTGAVAYDIHQSGSFNSTGSIALSGSIILPDNTHMGIGVTPSVTPGIKLHIKGNTSTTDPSILLEGYDIMDSAHISYKNPDVQWDFGLSGGSTDQFLLSNQTENQIPFSVDYSSSNSAIVLRNDTGDKLFQRVGINWAYEDLDIGTTVHHLSISGSATASAGFYGELVGTASAANKVKNSNAIANITNPILFSPGVTPNNYVDVMSDDTKLNWDSVDSYLSTTTISASDAIGLHGTSSCAISSSYALTASYLDTGGSGLWFDGTTYISSSTTVSSSVFKGALSTMDYHTTEIMSSGSIFHGTTFSGSYISASNATNTTIIAPNFITLDDPTESFIMNRNTDGILSLGVGGSISSNAAIRISSSVTPSLQTVNFDKGPIWLSNQSMNTGEIYQIKGEDNSYLEWEMAINGSAPVSSTTDVWSMDFASILYPLTTASPTGTLVVKTCVTVYKQTGIGVVNNISGYYEISTAQVLNSGVMGSYVMGSGTGFQDVEVLTTGMAFVTPQYSNPSTNTLNFQLDLTAGDDMVYNGKTTFKWSDY